jgi:hypothetical protein
VCNTITTPTWHRMLARMRVQRTALLLLVMVAIVAFLPADAAKKKKKSKKAKAAVPASKVRERSRGVWLRRAEKHREQP